MPLLEVTTNICLENTPVFTTDASLLIAEMLGKPENYVMIRVNANTPLIFGASEDDCAHLKLKSLGLDESKTADYSAKLCDFIHTSLGIPAARIYIEFSSPERHMWGWDSKTF